MSDASNDAEQRLAESERFIRAITDNVAVRLAYFDLQGRFRFVNQVLCERFGRTREQMLGHTIVEVTQSTPSTAVARSFQLAIAGSAQRFEYADRVNGETRHILTQLIPDRDSAGNVIGVFGVGVDITSTVAAREELDRQTSTLNAIIAAIPAMVAVWDLDLSCRLANRAFETWKATRRELLVGKGLEEIIGAVEFAQAQPWVERVLRGETVSFESDSACDQVSRHITTNYTPLRAQDERVVGFISISQDITAQREEQMRLSLLSHRDPLTGLLNRTGFEEFLMEFSAHNSDSALAMLYIDLDYFKPINDTYGHATGDEVLRELAMRLLRVVGGSDAVGRIGGDEFAIALPAIASVEIAASTAKQVVQLASEPILTGNHTLVLGASVGVAINSGRGSWKELIARADTLAYQAKAEGRGRFVVEGRAEGRS
jgi:diguanylate cyclase (GGDEF)-like protein/PAS domain S-box-containing protein